MELTAIPFRVQRLHSAVPLPRKMGPFEAGFDLYVPLDTRIAAKQASVIPLGIAVEIPPGHVGLLKDRSSMAACGVHVLGGVIDSTYRGEIKVILYNLKPTDYLIEANSRIVQLVILQLPWLEMVEVVELSTTERGTGGFGSSGK